MEILPKNFIFYIATLTSSLSYCYFISSKLPKGIYRFISILPILFIFSILPLQFTHLFPTALGFSFNTWLTNFKLIRFAFELDQSPLKTSDSLLRFTTVASLPIKTTNSTSIEPSRTRSTSKLGLQIVIFAILAAQVQNYRNRIHLDAIKVCYSVMLFLIIDIVTGIVNSLVKLFTGLELESSSNEPYFATSIQNFWSRWNLLVTNTLRQTVYKPVRFKFSDRAWAPHAGVLASFFVSGLMHEVFVYQLAPRESVTWEMTWFFTFHGICVVCEMYLKRFYGHRWRLPAVVSTVLSVGFVAVTACWWFFPPLMRSGVDVKVLNEYRYSIDFIKNKLFPLQ